MSDEEDERTRARLARKARRQRAKRRRILAAAGAELLESGLDGFTVAAVAARADLSKPAVYYYFDSREALLAGLLVDRFKAETLALIEAVDAAEDGPGAARALLRAYVAHYRGDLASFRMLQTWTLSAGSQTELLEREVYPLSWQVMSRVEAKLAAGQAAGEVHPDVTPRRLANVALMLGHGLVSMVAAMDAAGGALRFGLDDLLAEAEATLDRATRAPRS